MQFSLKMNTSSYLEKDMATDWIILKESKFSDYNWVLPTGKSLCFSNGFNIFPDGKRKRDWFMKELNMLENSMDLGWNLHS